jgi:hypothetical protein
VACAGCGDELPVALGDYAVCAIEGRCLACCTDFVSHCSDVERYEQEASDWLASVLAEADRDMREAGRGELGGG